MAESYEEWRSRLEQLEGEGEVNFAQIDQKAAQAGTSTKAIHAEMVHLGVKIPWLKVGAFLLCVALNCLHQSLPDAILNCAGIKKPEPKDPDPKKPETK